MAYDETIEAKETERNMRETWECSESEILLWRWMKTHGYCVFTFFDILRVCRKGVR